MAYVHETSASNCDMQAFHAIAATQQAAEACNWPLPTLDVLGEHPNVVPAIDNGRRDACDQGARG